MLLLAVLFVTLTVLGVKQASSLVVNFNICISVAVCDHIADADGARRNDFQPMVGVV